MDLERLKNGHKHTQDVNLLKILHMPRSNTVLGHCDQLKPRQVKPLKTIMRFTYRWSSRGIIFTSGINNDNNNDKIIIINNHV